MVLRFTNVKTNMTVDGLHFVTKPTASLLWWSDHNEYQILPTTPTTRLKKAKNDDDRRYRTKYTPSLKKTREKAIVEYHDYQITLLS